MLSSEQIYEIHRLHLVEKWPQRRIARQLHIGRHTLAKYLDNLAPPPSRRDRASKLDAFMPAVAVLLERDSKAPAPVLFQRLQTLGYDGGITILKDYLQAVREDAGRRRAYVRMEPSPGERFDIDWGHFGALIYNGLHASCTPSAWWNATVARCTWSSPTVRVSKPSCAATCMLSRPWAAAHANSGSIISPLPLPNMTATWCDSTRAFSPSHANIISSRGPAMLPQLGKREGRTSDRICTAELLAAALLRRSQ
jgi:hypothetical protein